jgi:hypothetical protein
MIALLAYARETGVRCIIRYRPCRMGPDAKSGDVVDKRLAFMALMGCGLLMRQSCQH